jgi:hypothetical protein
VLSVVISCNPYVLKEEKKYYTFEYVARAFFTGAIGFTGIDSERLVMVPLVLGCSGSGYKSGHMAFSIMASLAAPSLGTRPECRGGTKKLYSYFG